jgi:hydroxyacylglutathione hydrolase
MLLRRFYDTALAQASYMIGCQRTGDAIIVDPSRAIDQYLEAAIAEKMRITRVTETHIHADYLSGSRELAERTGAELLLSAEGGQDWSYRFATERTTLVRDGDRFMVGNIAFEVMHTPGHTPEHIVFLVTDTPATDRPLGILSGDFIFVGDVGRPDLLERAAHVSGTMEGMARQLYASLQRTASLPDYLQVWPGHGAGSACGKALGAVPFSTLGYERIANWAFQQPDEATFVREVLAGQPEPPRYFARMKALNRDGPPPVPRQAPPTIGVSELEQLARDGVIPVDPRPTADFAAGHIPGSVHVPLGSSFATWAGTVLPADAALVLVGVDTGDAMEAVRTLQLIGMDDVRGIAPASVLADHTARGQQLAAIPGISAKAASRSAAPVVDVRGSTEWNGGHAPGARHVFLGDLADTMADAPRDTPMVVQCQGGTRSVIAASLLRRMGFRNITNLEGGFDAWRMAALPVVTEPHA